MNWNILRHDTKVSFKIPINRLGRKQALKTLKEMMNSYNVEFDWGAILRYERSLKINKLKKLM